MQQGMKCFLIISLLSSLLMNAKPAVSPRTLVSTHEGYYSNGQECKSNFECATSCCDKSSCVEIAKCKIRVTYIYISVGTLSALFLLVIVIFFVITIHQTRKNVARIRQENQKKAEEYKNQTEINKKKAEEAQKASDKKKRY